MRSRGDPESVRGVPWIFKRFQRYFLGLPGVSEVFQEFSRGFMSILGVFHGILVTFHGVAESL